MKRIGKNLRYSPAKRRVNLDATTYGPAIKLVGALALLIALVLVMLFVLLPFLKTRIAQSELFGGESVIEQQTVTPAPTNPILANAVQTVRYAEGYGLPAAVVDPYVFENTILFATGESANACTYFVRLDPETGEFTSVEAARTHDTLRSPVENADYLLYVDAKLDGGGDIRLIDKATGENTVLLAIAAGVPQLQLEYPYLVWMEQAPNAEAKLYVLDLAARETLTLASFGSAAYGASDPSLKSGQVLYADADSTDASKSLIRTVLLSDGSRWDYSVDGGVHDPKSAGNRWAYLSGAHDGKSDLFVVSDGGAARRVARGVVDFAITPACVLYNRDETVFAYVFSDDKTYVLSETGSNAQLVAAGGDYALWRDMTDPDAPVWKYCKVV